jgi:hypothetical protein
MTQDKGRKPAELIAHHKLAEMRGFTEGNTAQQAFANAAL